MASSSRTSGASGRLSAVPATAGCGRQLVLVAGRGRCCTLLLYRLAARLAARLGGVHGADSATFRFSGRTYPQLAEIVRELCAVAGRWCLPLVAAVAVTVAVSPGRDAFAAVPWSSLVTVRTVEGMAPYPGQARCLALGFWPACLRKLVTIQGHSRGRPCPLVSKRIAPQNLSGLSGKTTSSRRSVIVGSGGSASLRRSRGLSAGVTSSR